MNQQIHTLVSGHFKSTCIGQLDGLMHGEIFTYEVVLILSREIPCGPHLYACQSYRVKGMRRSTGGLDMLR